MFGNGKSEIDVHIQGKDIPKVTWVFIGLAILLISVGVCISFVIRGTIGVSRAQMQVEQVLEEVQTYVDEL